MGTWPVGSITKKCIIVGACGTEKYRKGRGVPGCHCSLQEHAFLIDPYFLFLDTCGWACTCQDSHVEVSGHLSRVSSLLPRGSQRSNSGH